MGASPIDLDPDLEEVLRDIAADPDARLFHTSPRRVFTGLRRFDFRASVAQAGLGSAERELLSTHRAEVAWLLRQMWVRLHLASPESRALDPYERPTVGELTQRSAVASERRGDDVERAEGADLLLRCLERPDDFGDVRTEDLLLASLRLENAPATRVCLALDLCAHGQPRTALALASDVVECRPPVEVRTAAWETTAHSHAALDADQQALECYLEARAIRALASMPRDVLAIPVMNALLRAVLLGEAVQARALAHELDELLECDNTLLRGQVHAIKSDRELGRLSVSDSARAIARGLADEVGPASREVLNATR